MFIFLLKEIIFSLDSMRTLYIFLLAALFFGGETSAQGYTALAGSIDSAVVLTNQGIASNPLQALATSQKAQVHALRRNDSILFARALVMEGKARFHLKEIAAASAQIHQGLTIFEKYQHEEGLLQSYYELAIIEAATGQTYAALMKLKRCLTLARQHPQKKWQAKVLHQIAKINYEQGELDLAWDRTIQAQIFISDNRDIELNVKLQNLQGLILLENGELNTASTYFEHAMSLAARTADSLLYMELYYGLAKLEVARKDYVRALNYARQATRLSQKTGGPGSFSKNLLLLSQIHLLTGELDQAVTLASEANSKAWAIENMPSTQRDASRHLAQVYLAAGDSARAFVYSTKANHIDDSVLNDEVSKFVLLPEDSSKSPHSAEGGPEEQAKGSSPDFTNDKTSMIIIGGLLFICALLTILLIRKKERSPQNIVAEVKSPQEETKNEQATDAAEKETIEAAIRQRVNEVEHLHQQKLQEMEDRMLEQERIASEKQAELDAQNKRYQEMDKTKNKVFSVLTHDLRQPINQIKSVLNLLEMEELDRSDRKEIVDKLKESVDNSSNALENLLLWSKKQLTGINTRIVDVHLLPQVWQIESQLKPNLEAKGLKLEINIPDFFKVKADMNQLDICLRNLLTNAIKFSHRDGTVTIDAIEESGQKIIRVIDHGVGMTTEQLDKLRGVADNFSTLGTMNEKGTGLGILITREFMENQNGKLEIMSRKGEGSIFSLVFNAGSAPRPQSHSESENF